jgi:sterol desaturase/sphingolipid hydroxylase (fatty acid hydroxylase superfamily)
MNAILTQEPALRLTVFLGVLIAMALWELAAPRRRQDIPRFLRWSNNMALVVIDTVLVRLLFPVTAVAWAHYVQDHGWGALNLVSLPIWLSLIVSLLLLDLVIYAQHVVFHAVPFLWRLHRMHHADLEFDVTTGVRFHPGEILLSMALKFAVIFLLGPPAIAVLLFEVALNATSLFNHSNARLPVGIDRWLRLLVVTPDMHRVHHSIEPTETNSNFGFNMPWWDRLFGTYKPQPKAGHEAMTIGLEEFRDPGELRIDRMLVQPLK